jgi:hypothetical protein
MLTDSGVYLWLDAIHDAKWPLEGDYCSEHARLSWVYNRWYKTRTLWETGVCIQWFPYVSYANVCYDTSLLKQREEVFLKRTIAKENLHGITNTDGGLVIKFATSQSLTVREQHSYIAQNQTTWWATEHRFRVVSNTALYLRGLGSSLGKGTPSLT